MYILNFGKQWFMYYKRNCCLLEIRQLKKKKLPKARDCNCYI